MGVQNPRRGRRSFLQSVGGTVVAATSRGQGGGSTPGHAVEQWGVFEVELAGSSAANPFLDTALTAEFRHEHRPVHVAGFYDGGGRYRIRFMPDRAGEWTYTTASNRPELQGKTGSFLCLPAQGANHGPVLVNHTYHFAYADGTPYRPFGTTCYAWVHQGDALEEQTLATLRTAPFNKMRMCIFPKSYAYNENEPQYYPFPRSAGGVNEYTAFHPPFFAHLEKRILDLQSLGIEADLILFHPYDRWGYANMPADVDDRYLRYAVARLSAYRNVWWSLANEYDFMTHKSMADWDRFFRIVQESDPYAHLRSIHHGRVMYDHAKPWVTHASLQDDDFSKTEQHRREFRKPVVYDECKYEGNIHQRWGNLPAHEMARRFWLGCTAGAYVGHGETYLDSRDVLWWSKGGTLRGESPQRIAFLRRILAESPNQGLEPTSTYYQSAGQPGEYYLYFFDLHQPVEAPFELDAAHDFEADVIEPWDMKVTRLDGRYHGKFTLKLPGKPYLAVRFTRVRA